MAIPQVLPEHPEYSLSQPAHRFDAVMACSGSPVAWKTKGILNENYRLYYPLRVII
jgi:hypothetical protein